MKRYYSVLCLLWVFVGLCANQVQAKKRHVAAHASASKIDSLYFFQPVSVIGKISYADKYNYDDSLSKRNQDLQAQVIRSYADRMKLAGLFPVTDTALNTRVENEIVFLLLQAHNKKYLEDLQEHSVIDSLMDAAGRRYALIELNMGFVRTAQSYKQMQRENRSRMLAAQLSLFGGSYEISVFAASDMYVMIIDAQENKTYYYNEDQSGINEVNPLVEASLKNQFRTLFEGFFFSKPNMERW